jgi:hypothetical protein
MRATERVRIGVGVLERGATGRTSSSTNARTALTMSGVIGSGIVQ